MAQVVAGLILAGGAGERYGGPKALARLPDGTTFLQRCGETLRAAGAAPLMATVPPGADAIAIPGVLSLPLPRAGLDMFASIRHGLSRLLDSPDWTVVAVLPVDHPLVASESVGALAAGAAPSAVPLYRGKRGHPVCLTRALAEALVAGALPGATLRDALRVAGRVDVEVDDPGVVANCNTPDRLQEALAARR